MCARITNGRPGTRPARYTWGRESSSAILKLRCRTSTRGWCSTAAADTAPRWPPTTCKRWAIPTPFRSMADGKRGSKRGCRWRSDLTCGSVVGQTSRSARVLQDPLFAKQSGMSEHARPTWTSDDRTEALPRNKLIIPRIGLEIRGRETPMILGEPGGTHLTVLGLKLLQPLPTAE